MKTGTVITTAGKSAPAQPADPRSAAIAAARRVLRDQTAPESAVDAALEMLLELSRE